MDLFWSSNIIKLMFTHSPLLLARLAYNVLFKVSLKPVAFLTV